MSDTEDYCKLHNYINSLYHAIKEGRQTNLEHIEYHLKYAIEQSAGMTFEEGANLLQSLRKD